MSLAHDLQHLVQPFAADQVGLLVSHGDEVVLNWHADHMFPAASLIKLAILTTTMSRHPNLETSVSLASTPVVAGAGVLQLMPSLTQLPLKTVLTLMLAVSDNYAANLAIQRLSMSTVNKWLEANGYQVTRLNRLLMDTKASGQGFENVTTATEAWRLFRYSMTRFPETKQWFGDQQFRYKLPAAIDEIDTPITVLNKTGEGPYVDHDVARFSLADDDYDVALLTAGITDRTQVIQLHEQVGQLIAKALLRNC